MANLIRTAKSGNDWTINDLESYSIQVVRKYLTAFFGVQALPEPVVDPELLCNSDAQAMQQDRNAKLMNLLHFAMIDSSGGSAVVDFAVELFKTLGYVRRALEKTLFISPAAIQEDKRAEDREFGDAQAQLVAGAIAVFEENNNNRVAEGLEVSTEKVIPGIVMAGTSPTFYKIPVTNNLMTHVHHGTYPPDITSVIFCQPPAPRPARRRSEGMKSLDSRRHIFSCY